jgi:hypothetical protein
LFKGSAGFLIISLPLKEPNIRHIKNVDKQTDVTFLIAMPLYNIFEVKIQVNYGKKLWSAMPPQKETRCLYSGYIVLATFLTTFPFLGLGVG